jgi:hypothetical protein
MLLPLKKLKKINAIVKLKKCKFGKKNIEFLKYIVKKNRQQSEIRKIEKIKNIKKPKNVIEIRLFLRLYLYYRKFINGFLKITKPLNNLVKKDIKFKWRKE